ncbi:MAG: hypothetical protein V3W31_04760 [Thermodesulfobacteriota bacterium]
MKTGSTTGHKPREWVTVIVGTWVVLGVAFAGLTFAYKVYEIVNTIPRGEVVGFAVIQVITYLFVAVGFFFLFVWSFLKGDFKDVERAKYRVLEMEEKMVAEEKRLGIRT